MRIEILTRGLRRGRWTKASVEEAAARALPYARLQGIDTATGGLGEVSVEPPSFSGWLGSMALEPVCQGGDVPAGREA